VKIDGLITSELILIADYRTLGLSNPRINEPSDYWTLGLSTYNRSSHFKSELTVTPRILYTRSTIVDETVISGTIDSLLSDKQNKTKEMYHFFCFVVVNVKSANIVLTTSPYSCRDLNRVRSENYDKSGGVRLYRVGYKVK